MLVVITISNFQVLFTIDFIDKTHPRNSISFFWIRLPIIQVFFSLQIISTIQFLEIMHND